MDYNFEYLDSISKELEYINEAIEEFTDSLRKTAEICGILHATAQSSIYKESKAK